MTDQTSIQQFTERGFAIARQLFTPDEVQTLIQHFMDLRAKGGFPGDFAGVDANSSDPLKRFPRMIHMHRWDQQSMDWLIDTRLNAWMTALLGREPYAVQTMLYFKPAGARGQALHQDQFYLQVQPGTCMAAWLALDDCDEENGCLQVVPGTHNIPVLCTTEADTSQSFTDVTVPIPAGYQAEPVIMKAGDVLFFNGQLVHGSYPNTSADRFRRALIGHYIVGEAEKVATYYHPVLRMDGSEVELGVSERGGPCGVWVNQAGEPAVEMMEPM
ncbi:MAG: phytanoyl-CoA dioxygenase family protein [Caldilineaceae bacterium]|nr:phytanoyl-CoA dioxygenase family protein [Caldilineaceae bacterium]MCB0097253.1 phytanoyl-CoA dioxygenase family protein [Caldilineaceae bacterium]MCB0142809.1 phytanoyl-CoA dioxygenase family protein [Caldilineaceae bacterium]